MRRVAVRLLSFVAVLAATFGGAYALGDRVEPVRPPAHDMNDMNDPDHDMDDMDHGSHDAMSTDIERSHEHVALELTGMTCAACASRIEKKLNRLDGVTATVNYATEQATRRISTPTWRHTDTLIATVQSIGYDAALPAPIGEDRPDASLARLADLRRRLVVAIVLGVPVLLLSMIPPLQFRGWQWVALARLQRRWRRGRRGRSIARLGATCSQPKPAWTR